MSDDQPKKQLILTQDSETGRVEPAYDVGEGLLPGGHGHVHVKKHEYDEWRDDVGMLHLRRKEGAISVGYSRSYSSNFDSIDWGN